MEPLLVSAISQAMREFTVVIPTNYLFVYIDRGFTRSCSPLYSDVFHRMGTVALSFIKHVRTVEDSTIWLTSLNDLG